jgi:hypothetical protein
VSDWGGLDWLLPADHNVSEDPLTASRALGHGTDDGFRLLLKPMSREVERYEAIGAAAGAKDHAGHRGTGVPAPSVRKSTPAAWAQCGGHRGGPETP